MALSKILLPDGVTELANVKSVTFKEAVNSGVDLRPGCVGSASIEVEVFNTQPNAVSAGDALTYYQIDKNNTQTLIGVFYAEPVIATKNSYKFIAYDAAQKLNADFSAWLMANQSNFPMTIYALVSAACTVAGVTLGSVSWPLSTENVEAFYADGLSCRDILSYAAELACRFVRCDSSGNITFAWYTTATNKRIYPSAGTSGSETRYAYKQDGLQYTNYTTAALDGVAVHPSGEDDVAYIYPTSASGNLLNITNNLLLTGADAALFNAAAQNIFTELSAVGAYRPTTANLFPRENPFRAGDVVAVTDAQAVSFITVIMEQTVNESDAVLSSTGNEYYSDADGNTQKALTQLASDIVRINKLKVDWADINTAIINYLTANDVVAQNLTIVDANDVVLATFNANGITLGQTDEAHAELDFNSFILKDKDGNTYFAVGDERDANGEVNVTLNYVGDGSTTAFDFIPYLTTSLANTVAVTIDGNVESNFTTALAQITFATAPADGSEIVITYTTKYALYHYDVGSRLIGSNVGTYSFVAGNNNTASQPYSSVCGGVSNKANGQYSAIGNGLSNETKNKFSYIGGGQQNEATGVRSFIGGGSRNQALGGSSTIAGGTNNVARNAAVVCGGISNKARGDYSAVGGGLGNVAAGQYGAIVGGEDNSISSGSHAVICGGQDNRVEGKYGMAAGHGSLVKRRSAFAFGEYNVEDSQGSDQNSRGDYVEIVGNGTADNARSNARTLDWSGNEYIAGALSVGDAATTRANIGAVNIAGDTMTGGLTIEKSSGDTYFYAKRTDTSIDARMGVGSGGRNHGVYSTGYNDGTFHSSGKWMIYRNNSGDIIVNGHSTDDFNLQLGTNIPNNSDLNDYTTPGTYYCANGTIAATLSNMPSGVSAGFKLVVYYKGSTGNINQELHPNGSEDFYIRYQQSSTWYSWKRVLDTDDLPLSVANGGTGATTAEGAADNLGVLKRYAINSGNGITTSVKRKLSFSAAVLGTLRVFGNTASRCGEYIVYGGTSNVVVEPTKAASACSITTGTGYFQITSTSGSLYVDLLTASPLSRISETAGT